MILKSCKPQKMCNHTCLLILGYRELFCARDIYEVIIFQLSIY